MMGNAHLIQSFSLSNSTQFRRLSILFKLSLTKIHFFVYQNLKTPFSIFDSYPQFHSTPTILHNGEANGKEYVLVSKEEFTAIIEDMRYWKFPLYMRIIRILSKQKIRDQMAKALWTDMRFMARRRRGEGG